MEKKYYVGFDKQLYETDDCDVLNVRGKRVDLNNPPEELSRFILKGIARRSDSQNKDSNIIDMARNKNGTYSVV
jgi:hypothetical protein